VESLDEEKYTADWKLVKSGVLSADYASSATDLNHHHFICMTKKLVPSHDTIDSVLSLQW